MLGKITFYTLSLLVLASCTTETKKVDDQFFVKEEVDIEQDAFNQLLDSLEKDPKNIDLWIKKGNICKDELDFACALDAGAKAFMIDSTNIPARNLYAWTLINKPNAPISDIERAKRHFQYILSIQPKDPEALVNLANTFSLTGDFKTAIKYINEALKIDINYRDGYVLKGSIYKVLGNNDIALSSYQTAIQIDPNFFLGHLNTGWLLTEIGNHKLALEYYENASRLNPESINALYGVAKSLQDLEKYDEALVEYRKIEELEPSFYITYFNQGYIKHHYQNQLDSAEYFYEKVVQRNPEYIGAWYQLGEVYYQQKRYTKAANSYAEALHIDEDFEPAKQAAEKLRNIKVK